MRHGPHLIGLMLRVPAKIIRFRGADSCFIDSEPSIHVARCYHRFFALTWYICVLSNLKVFQPLRIHHQRDLKDDPKRSKDFKGIRREFLPCKQI